MTSEARIFTTVSTKLFIVQVLSICSFGDRN